MIYIYDILLNWCKDAQGIEFFEWRETDELEHIKKIPLVRISSSMMRDLSYLHIEIEKAFLNRIEDKTESFFDDHSDVITYAVLFSDGKKCLAFEFDSSCTSIYKSALLLDEEEEVLELVGSLPLTKINYQVTKREKDFDYLTRTERENRKFLLKELVKIREEKEKIDYLYEEYFEQKGVSREEKYQKLTEKIMSDSGKIEKELKDFFLTVSHKKV